MNIISAVLILAAILSALLGIGFLVIWLRGVNSILLPGLGLLVATRLIVALLLIVAVVIAFLALLTKSGSINTAQGG